MSKDRVVKITVKLDSSVSEQQVERLKRYLEGLGDVSTKVSGRNREVAETAKRIGAELEDSAKHGTNGLGKLLVQLNLLDRAVGFLSAKFRESLQTAFDIDTARTRITAMVGDANKASQKMAELQKLAINSVGVTIKSAYDAYSQLKGIGGIGEETINKLIKSLGRLNAAFTIDSLPQFQRNLVQIFTQGFEIQDIKEALGYVPIFRQLIKQAFNTDDPEVLKTLKESGELTLDQWLSGLANAIDANQNISNLQENLSTRFTKANEQIMIALSPIADFLLKVFVPALELLNSSLHILLPVFGALTGAIVVLYGEWLILNTTLVSTRFSAIVAGLQQILVAVQGVIAGTATLGTTLTVATGGLALLGVAAGVAYYAFTKYSEQQKEILEGSSNFFKNIEVEVASLNKQSDTIKQLSTTTANLTLEHDRLSEIYKSLNILSRARVDNAIAEKGAVNALVEEINKLNAAKGTEIESRLVLLAKDAVAAFKALQEASKEAETANSKLEQARQTGLNDIPIYSAKGEQVGVKSATDQFYELNKSVQLTGDAFQQAQKEYDNYKEALQQGLNVLRQVNGNQDLTLEKFLQQKVLLKELNPISNDFISSLSSTSQGQKQLADDVQRGTNEINKQAEAVGRLTSEFNSLLQTTQSRLDEKASEIALNAKNAAEARLRAREALKNEEIINDLKLKKRLEENKRAIDEVWNPRNRNVNRTQKPTSRNAQVDQWINKYAMEYGIDPLLIFAQMFQESEFKGNAISGKGARGYMQVMPGTFETLKRQFPGKFTNINDPQQNIEAGIIYLAQQLTAFGGNLPLALAAYNAGPGAVQKYGGVPPYKETRNYVNNILRRFSSLKGGETDFSFDTEASNRELSDAITKAYEESVVALMADFYKTVGSIPTRDAIGKITRVAVENARQRGELQPSEQDVIRQFELNKLNKLGERGEILTEPATVTKEISTRRTLDEEFVRNLRIRYGLERDINSEYDRRDNLILEQRNYLELVNAQVEDYQLGLEEALESSKREFDVLQKRNFALESELAIIRERNDLVKQIGDLQLQISTVGQNDDLIIQTEYLKTILSLRQKELNAVIAIQKAELELSQALEISTSQIRARVLEHLAQQKTLNESIADGIVRTYEQAANKIEKVLDKAFIGKVPVIGDIIKTLTRNSLTNITRSLLDAFVPGLGTELAKTNNPIARPIVDEVQQSNRLLSNIDKNIARATGGSSTLGGIGGIIQSITNVFDSVQQSNQFSGQPNVGLNKQSLGHYGTRTGDLVDGMFQIFAGDKGRKDIWSNIKNIFSGKDGSLFGKGGIFGPKGFGFNTGTIGGLASLASVAGGLIGGRVGGVISSVAGGALAGLTLGAKIGAIGGPLGAAIGAGAGLLMSLFGGLFGDPKRKEDKQVNIPNLQKGFVDAIKQLNEILSGVRTLSIDPDDAIRQAMEIRGQIAAGFGIDFKSKKYRNQAQQLIQSKLAEADRIINEIKAAAEIARGAADRSKRILPEFARGHYFADYFRPNGLVPGIFDGRDNILALISRGEMVLNPRQQARVRALAGYDVFAGAGIPNYPSAASSPKLATGGIAGGGRLELAAPTVVVNPVITIEGMPIGEEIKAYLTSDDGRRTQIQVNRQLKRRGDI